MDDYLRTFEARGDRYARASRRWPAARTSERRLLLDRLDLALGVVVCDAPAGSGFVADGIAERMGAAARVICVEPSAVFGASIDPRHERHVAPLELIPLPAGSVDRVASLAGLHHLDEVAPFFREAARILRPGGRLAVADVAAGSAPARFLDDTVHRLSATGHTGSYVTVESLRRDLGDAGLRVVEARVEDFTWDFPDEGAMLEFVRELFGLVVPSEDLGAELVSTLGANAGPNGAHIPWSLVYASAVKVA